MSRGNGQPKAVGSVYECKYRLHLFFASVHRVPRYSTGCCGKSVDEWKRMDAFEIGTGSAGGLILVYDSRERNAWDAQEWLFRHGYDKFIACGRINSLIAKPAWHFEKPIDNGACVSITKEIVSEPEFLRYFSKHLVTGADGSRLGQACSFYVPNGSTN